MNPEAHNICQLSCEGSDPRPGPAPPSEEKGRQLSLSTTVQIQSGCKFFGVGWSQKMTEAIRSRGFAQAFCCEDVEVLPWRVTRTFHNRIHLERFGYLSPHLNVLQSILCGKKYPYITPSVTDYKQGIYYNKNYLLLHLLRSNNKFKR